VARLVTIAHTNDRLVDDKLAGAFEGIRIAGAAVIESSGAICPHGARLELPDRLKPGLQQARARFPAGVPP